MTKSLSEYVLLQLPLSFCYSVSSIFEAKDMEDAEHEKKLIMDDLGLKYKPLIGMDFEAIYKGGFEMPQTGNERDVLLVKESNPFARTLHEISKAVKEAYGRKIWKGITGPEDSANFTDYQLWVETCFYGELEVGSCRNFRVVRCTPFQGNGVKFSYGVSIEVSVIPLAAATTQSDSDG